MTKTQLTKAQRRAVRLERAFDLANRKLNACREIQDKAYRVWENAWWSLSEAERDGLRTPEERIGD
jgi:hypothetical protein